MYISKKYLREKYEKLKHDMENVLNVLDEEGEDRIPEELVKRVFENVKDSSNSIIRELLKHDY